MHAIGPPTWACVVVEKIRMPGEPKLELHTQTSFPAGVSSASASENPPGA